MPQRVVGSGDGLMIIDSLTGEALAERIEQAADWQPFRLVRACPRASSLVVTFALSGLGEAWLDDVSVQTLDAAESGGLAAGPVCPPGGSRR